jgi:sugar phosphate isomerase/epimerase
MSVQQPTRRDLIKLGGAAVAAVAAGAWPQRLAGAAWKNLPVGTQAWCVRKQLATDIPGTLAAVAKAGFELLELENAFGRSGAEWKAALGAAGLKPAGFHHHFADVRGDKLAATIEFNQALGNRNLIVRSLPGPTYTSLDELKKVADELNAAAEKLAPHGLRVGYHNHTTDFNVLDGEYWWYRFADLTSKEVVLQYDTGNAAARDGVDAVAVLKRTPGRVKSMHIKPHSKAKRDAFIGADELAWTEILTAAESTAGVEIYLIEYEVETGRPPVEDLAANLAAFRKLRA